MEVDTGQGQQQLLVKVELGPAMLTLRKLVCFWSQALRASPLHSFGQDYCDILIYKHIFSDLQL